MLRRVLSVIGAFGLLAATPANAEVQTTTTLTFNSLGTLVDSFATVFGYTPGTKTTPAFSLYGGPDITPGETTFGAISTPDFVLDSYFYMGVTGPFSGETSGARHLVLGVNQSLAGQDFASLFPGYDETALIDAIVALNADTAPAFGAEYQLLSGFQSALGSQYAFNLDGTGYLTAFSSGTNFGTIVTKQTIENIPGAVPETATWIMLIVGVGVTGATRRRRSYQLR